MRRLTTTYCDQREDETGQQFVEVLPFDRDKVLHDEDRPCTHDDACQSTPLRGSPPHEGEDHERSEGSSETTPGVSHHVEDRPRVIRCDNEGDEGKADDASSADPFPSFLAHTCDHGNVFGEGGGENKQL